MSKLDKLLRKYRVTKGRKFRLEDHSPADTDHFVAEKKKARALLQRDIERLASCRRSSTRRTWAVLLIFQAMDAAGKDSTIKHVMSGVNPQGCEVYSFKAPSAEELDHDFLWRATKRLPERGRIGIFNRSYYEEVLVVRVHPEILGEQKLPPRARDEEASGRSASRTSARFERYLSRNGVVDPEVLPARLKEEQKQRFLERLDEPGEELEVLGWPTSNEREHWDDYMAAYEDMIRHTATPARRGTSCPPTTSGSRGWWWRRRSIDAMERPRLAFPKVDAAKKAELAAGAEDPGGRVARGHFFSTWPPKPKRIAERS